MVHIPILDLLALTAEETARLDSRVWLQAAILLAQRTAVQPHYEAFRPDNSGFELQNANPTVDDLA